VLAGGEVTPSLVLLDRDGTINEPAAADRYVADPESARLLPGAAAAIRRLNAAGVPVVVVTNQRGVATGKLSSSQLDRVNSAITARLAESGARLDGWYVCPHDVGACDCRKPLPGLLARALADRPGLEPADCVVVGDAESDVLAGQAIGIRGVLLHADLATTTAAVSVQRTLADAVQWLLGPDDDTVTGW
jgi:D-glycero-D-manno-heptose 1,7-bisphosphate phosphatase